MQTEVNYISLANKYRPQTFEDMIGQDNISKTLKNALKLGRVAHAYLFYGPRGCGKTTTARILAKALNCTGNGNVKPTGEPCGQCPQCLEIAQSADMDVLELDAASNTQVEKVREAIIDTVALASSRDRFKVFILDEVHMLSSSSFNALLKTIEEPPQHVVFILATTEKHKVPATIVSRCQTFRFRPITVDEITTRLMELAEAEGIDLTESAARVVAKNAGGAMRDALTLLDRVIAYGGGKIDEKLVGEILGLTPQELLKDAVSAMVAKDNAGLHAVFETLKAEGFDANSFLKDLKNALGELFYFSLGQGAEPFDGAKQLLDGVSPGFLAGVSRKINKLADEVKFSDDALVSAEVGLFTVMDSCLDIEVFVRRLEALERGGPQAPSSTPPASSAPKRAAVSAVKTTKPSSFTQASAEEPASSVVKPAVQPAPEAQKAAFAAPAPQAVAGNPALADREVWDKLLRHFERSPFIYDVMTNCSVSFEAAGWTVRFGKDKAFYKVPAQNKLAELEKVAKEIAGRKITITIGADGEAVAQAAPAAAPKRAAAQTSVKPAAKTASVSSAKPAQGVSAISSEEPFVRADFAPAFEEDAEKTVAAPDELKDLLSIIPGEVLA